jgi:ATP-dependent Clp protease ATP-binding subunit ClpC
MASRRGNAPPLTPAAKRALQDAHRQAQAAGSSGIGAEHVLLGLGANPESRAAQALARALPDTDQLQGRPSGRQQRGASSTPSWTSDVRPRGRLAWGCG